MAIKFRRIKNGQVVGLQTINDLFENDRALEADIGAIAQRADELQGTMDEQDTKLEDFEVRVAAVESEVDAQGSSLDNALGRIQTAETDLAVTMANVDALGASLGTAHGNIASLDARVAPVENKQAAHDTTLASHDSRLASAEASIASHGTRITAAEAAVVALDGRLDDAETDLGGALAEIADHETRITDLESGGGGSAPTVKAWAVYKWDGSGAYILAASGGPNGSVFPPGAADYSGSGAADIRFTSQIPVATYGAQVSAGRISGSNYPALPEVGGERKDQDAIVVFFFRGDDPQAEGPASEFTISLLW